MAITYLFAAATLWGMIGPISKIVFAAGFSPLETAFWRGVLAGIAFIIHWLFKRYPFPTAPRQLFGLVLFGVFGVALLEGSYVYAVHFGGAALASVLLYSAPIWVNLASAVIFKEKIPIRRWTSLSITMAGVPAPSGHLVSTLSQSRCHSTPPARENSPKISTPHRSPSPKKLALVAGRQPHGRTCLTSTSSTSCYTSYT